MQHHKLEYKNNPKRLMISTKPPLVKREKKFVGANVIGWVANLLADLVIGALKETPVEMGW